MIATCEDGYVVLREKGFIVSVMTPVSCGHMCRYGPDDRCCNCCNVGSIRRDYNCEICQRRRDIWLKLKLQKESSTSIPE